MGGGADFNALVTVLTGTEPGAAASPSGATEGEAETTGLGAESRRATGEATGEAFDPLAAGMPVPLMTAPVSTVLSPLELPGSGGGSLASDAQTPGAETMPGPAEAIEPVEPWAVSDADPNRSSAGGARPEGTRRARPDRAAEGPLRRPGLERGHTAQEAVVADAAVAQEAQRNRGILAEGLRESAEVASSSGRPTAAPDAIPAAAASLSEFASPQVVAQIGAPTVFAAADSGEMAAITAPWVGQAPSSAASGPAAGQGRAEGASIGPTPLGPGLGPSPDNPAHVVADDAERVPLGAARPRSSSGDGEPVLREVPAREAGLLGVPVEAPQPALTEQDGGGFTTEGEGRGAPAAVASMPQSVSGSSTAGRSTAGDSSNGGRKGESAAILRELVASLDTSAGPSGSDAASWSATPGTGGGPQAASVDTADAPYADATPAFDDRLAGLSSTASPWTMSELATSDAGVGGTHATQRFASVLAQAEAFEGPEHVARQVVRSLYMQWRDGAGEARVQLHPEHLGHVTLSLKLDQGAVTATVVAETETAQRWIEGHRELLQQSLGEQGLKLDRLLVTTSREGHREPETGAQGQAHGHGQGQRKPAPRRLNQGVFEVRV